MTTEDAAAPERPESYERPTLVVIGNLRHFLAGSGTQPIDDQSCFRRATAPTSEPASRLPAGGGWVTS